MNLVFVDLVRNINVVVVLYSKSKIITNDMIIKEIKI